MKTLETLTQLYLADKTDSIALVLKHAEVVIIATPISEWIEYLGATAQFLTKEEHDFKAGLISHMPRLLAQALWDFVQLKDAASLEMAGPGFRSMTRLANQHPQLYREIMQYNESNIQKLWEEWAQFVSSKTNEGKVSCIS